MTKHIFAKKKTQVPSWLKSEQKCQKLNHYICKKNAKLKLEFLLLVFIIILSSHFQPTVLGAAAKFEHDKINILFAKRTTYLPI